MSALIKTWLGCLALSLGLFGVLGVAQAAAQTTNPAAVVSAFTDAYSRGDVARMRELVDPAFVVVPDPRDPNGHEENFDGFVKNHLVHVTASNIREISSNKAVADLVFSGPEFRPLPHPFTEQVTFTVNNGRIARMEERVSEQTFKDLQALGPMPGMPATGASDGPGAWALLATAALCLLAGLLARRIPASNRMASAGPRTSTSH